MLTGLAAGYYVRRFYVTPSDGDHAVMEQDQHEEANREVYTTGEGVERVDQPLVVKLEDHHLPVFGSDEVATDTLAVPASVLEACRITDPPALKSILVAKADRAVQLLEWFTPYTISEPDYV